MEINETTGTIPSPHMRFFLQLRAKDRKIDELQEELNTLEVRNDELENVVSDLKFQNARLLDRLNASSLGSRSAEVLEEKNDALQDRVDMNEVEIKKLKGVVAEKERRFEAAKVWVDTLESVNINLQREVEVLQCRVKEQSKSLTRMTGDMEAVEAEMLLEKAKAIRKENAAFTKIEELETQLSETRRILLVEKEMAHEKDHLYEESLATVNSRAHELSAKLARAERSIQELRGQAKYFICDCSGSALQFSQLLGAVKFIRENFAKLKEDVQNSLLENQKASQEAKAELKLCLVSTTPRDLLRNKGTNSLPLRHPVLLPEDEGDYILCKPLQTFKQDIPTVARSSSAHCTKSTRDFKHRSKKRQRDYFIFPALQEGKKGKLTSLTPPGSPCNPNSSE
ncbi:unnamed protein product [Enterobius vermicularis]|uniref:Cilia- and flagella-associated protein 157 n=1 Tax=Enterobius vermicularis TaxID=51028 RepID=A0A0N4V1E3_ENTVE|nr:unnamed protein product [Enterobius vermicularis]